MVKMNHPLPPRDMTAFFQHLKRVKTMKREVKCEPPKLRVRGYIYPPQFRGPMDRVMQVFQDNRFLIENINVNYRTKGRVCDRQGDTSYSDHLEANYALLRKRRSRELAIQNKAYKSYISRGESAYSAKKYNAIWEEIKSDLHIEKIMAPDSQSTCNICIHGILTKPAERNICYFDIATDEIKFGRLEMEIYTDVVPKSALNFVSICRNYENLTYEKSTFFRILPGLFCVGGDITKNNGTGSTSIYGDYFPNENYNLVHNCAGVISMFSTKPDQNNSQFLITFRKLETLNNKFVVIGRVINSLKPLQLIEEFGSRSGKPMKKININDCGVLK